MSDNLKRAESLFNRIMNPGKEEEHVTHSNREFGRHSHNSNNSHSYSNNHSHSNNHGGHHHGNNHAYRKHKYELLNHPALKVPEQIIENLTDQTILPYCWTIWHHSRVIKPDTDYLQASRPIDFPKYNNSKDQTKYIGSVEQMWLNLSLIKLPSELANTEYLIFKSGINPVWEDAFNTKGGRWIFKFNKSNNEQLYKNRLNLIWETLIIKVMSGSLINGEEHPADLTNYLLNDINGVVLSVRKDVNIISLWNSNLTKFKKNVQTRRLLCESILNVIKECDSVLGNDQSIDERVKGVSFEYRLHSNYNSNKK